MKILLCDGRNFFASCESVFVPENRKPHKAVAVCSANDGIIIAANTRSKEVGIKKFEAAFKQTGLIDLHSVSLYSSNFPLYSALSSRMMSIIKRNSLDYWEYSIDEAFITTPDELANDIATNIRQAAWRETKLPVNVGIADTIVLAKAANKLAKTSKTGTYEINRDNWAQSLRQLDASDIWGVGSKTRDHLRRTGINSAYELAQLDPNKARQLTSVVLERIVRELNFQKVFNWSEAPIKKEIYSTQTLGTSITSKEDLHQALAKHASTACRKARNQESLTKTIVIFANSNPFKPNPIYKRAFITPSAATNDTTTVCKLISQHLDQIWQDNTEFHKIGVGLINLVDAHQFQQDLFNPCEDKPILMNALDSINAKYGRETLFLAAQGGQTNWERKATRLSPSYLTKWHDIPNVKC